MAKISNIYFITAIVTIGGLLQGFDISSLSAILSTKPFKKHYGSPNSAKQGGITATISGGSFMGCHFAFFLIDRIGRKSLLQIGCLIFVVGAVLCVASVDIAMLIVGRFICGFAVGQLLALSRSVLSGLMA
jgi:MFS family permease